MNISDKPFVYVCSPYRGDIPRNTQNALEYCRQVYEAGYAPLAPHLYFPRFLNENDPAERRAGMLMGGRLLQQCRALAVCGDEISEGMAQEIKLAERFGIPVLTLEAFQPEADRELPRSLSVLAQAADFILKHKTPFSVGGDKHGIHVFIANPHERTPMGTLDTMLTLPVSPGDFAAALRLIGMDNQPNPDYFFHSIGTYDDRIRGFLPRALDRDAFDELNYLAAKLYGIDSRARGSFAVAGKNSRAEEPPSVKRRIDAARTKPDAPDNPNTQKRDKPRRRGPEL